MRVNLEIPITRPAQAAGFFVGRTPDLAVKMAPLNMDGMSGFHRMGTRLSLAIALGIGVALTGCTYGSRTEAEIACNKWAEKGRRFQHKAILQLARTLLQNLRWAAAAFGFAKRNEADRSWAWRDLLPRGGITSIQTTSCAAGMHASLNGSAGPVVSG